MERENAERRCWRCLAHGWYKNHLSNYKRKCRNYNADNQFEHLTINKKVNLFVDLQIQQLKKL